MEFNEFQSSLEDLNLDYQPIEVKEMFMDFISTVPYIQNLVSPDRKYARDLPRDDKGRIIVDITHPHILEDMDYFRPAARHFEKYGCYTKLRPNPNPNSEFFKWAKEEVRRCHEGYVRKSDGEWIPGDYYYFLNYAPMAIAKKEKGSHKAKRVMAFPNVWEGHYLQFHYLYQARENGHHGAELASRGKGKSFSVASLLAKRFNLGESEEVNKKVTCYVTASEKKYLVGGDQTLDKFKYDIDFTAQNTEWPSNRLINSLQNMQWIKGYTDMETKTDKGTLNSVIGITSKDDESKLRGSRGVLYILEEFGSFPRLLNLYQNLRPSVEDGRDVFGLIFMIGTAGDNESDFSSAQEIIYSPIGYNVQEIPNIYDKRGQGRPYFVYFFPEYLNRANCYNENGVSNVTKALLEICQDRYKVKNETTDVQAITKSVAERPVVPQEALLRTRGNMFPVVPLTERLNQLDNNPSIYDDVICGNLVWRSGEPQLQISQDKPIRQYPLKDNKAKGIIEIFQEPEFMPSGQPYIDRYIIGHDPVDDDSSHTMSLTSTFVLDLFTDQIVAEYTGRQDFADDNFEIVRLLCLYYHGKCLYEQNKKGIFAYFSRMNCLHLLADTPEYLRDKQLIKEIGWGNKSKGVNATLPVNNFANQLIKEWLMKPVPMLNESGEEVMMPNLYRLRNRALIEELIQYNEFANFDRVRALGMVMLYREEKMILYQGDAKGHNEDAYKNPILNDPFFSIYDDKLSPDSQKIIGD